MKSHLLGNKPASALVEARKHPTATVMLSRVPVFAPVTRLAPNRDNAHVTITFCTSFGKVTVSGKRLTQAHRDLIEAIFTHHTNVCRHPDTGDCTYFFHPYPILKKMGQKHPNVQQMRRLLDDLSHPKLRIEDKAGKVIQNVETGIVQQHRYTTLETRSGREPHFASGPYVVQFSAEFLRIFEVDLAVHYPELVDKILLLESPLARATVRFFLTHDKFNLSITKLLPMLGVMPETISSRAWRQKLQELRGAAPELEGFGIFLQENSFRYNKHASVWFTRQKPAGS